MGACSAGRRIDPRIRQMHQYGPSGFHSQISEVGCKRGDLGGVGPEPGPEVLTHCIEVICLPGEAGS